MARKLWGRAVQNTTGSEQTQRPANANARQADVAAPGQQAVQCHAILEHIMDGFIALDWDCRCTYANKAAAAFLNTTTEQLIGRSIWDALPPARYRRLHEGIAWAVEQRVFVKFEEYCEQCGRWFEWHCCPNEDSLAIFIVDASERKEAEEQVVRSEQHYRLLFETMPQGVVYQDADGKIISMNPAAERILGRTPEEFLGRTSVDEEYHTLRDDGTPFPGLEHPSMVALRTGQEIRDVVMGVFNPRDRAYHWINITAVPLVRPGENKPYQVYTHFSDITGLRQAERALRHSERHFRKLFEADLMGVFITKPDGTFLDCNEAMAKMLGYDSREELLQHRSTELYVDPEFRAEAVHILQTEGIYLGKEGRLWRKDGSIAHILGAAVLLKDEETGEPYVQGVAVDVTERKWTEEALRASEERYRKLFEANMAGVYLVKLDGTILDFNDAMMKMLGYDSRAELFQHRVVDFYADPKFRQEMIRRLRQNGFISGQEVLLRKKDGSLLYAFGSAVLLTDERTRELYIQGVAIDVTERKKAEDHLARNLRDMEVLSVSATHFLEAMPSQELFQYTARQLQAVAGRAVIAVTEYRTDTNQTIVRAVVGPKDKLRKVSLLLRRDPAGMAFTVAEGTRQRMARGRLEHVTGGLHDLTFYQMPLPLCLLVERVLHVGKIYAMPFYLGDDLMGTVAVATDRAEGLQNRELIEAIVNQAALALKRTRTEEALRESKERLAEELADTQLLQGISAELIKQDHIVALYEKILDAAVAIMHSDYASLQMLYPDQGTGGELRLLASHGFSPQASQFWEWVRAGSESTCGVALRTGKRVVVPDVEKCKSMANSEDRAIYLQTGIRAVQTMPLLSRTGKLVGMISTHWRHPHEPSERDWRLLDILARQAADLIEQRQAEEALREWNATLESRVAQRTAELEHRTRQLQKMTLELSQAEDRERRRMAEILHDDLQQIIAGAKFHLNLLRNHVKSDGYLQALGGQIDQMLKDAIEKSRGLSHELSPVVLQKSDFAEALGWLAGQMRAKHGLIVHVHADDTADLQSDAIKSFLYRTAQELLFNIIKHARVNEANIRLRRRGPCICLSVRDCGRGFDPRELREAAGFGLLSIRERIELLGGRMKIRSAPGRGSTFFVMVPDRETADAQTPPLGQPLDIGPSVEKERRGLRVLLAEDHRIVRDGLRLLLGGEHDIEVVGEAMHGRDAVDLALRLEPDVVIMDVAMPLIDGDEATRQIKKRLPKTRVVALSTYNEPEIIEKMYQAGAESYVLKTASSEELVSAIRGKESHS